MKHKTELVFVIDPMCSWCWGFHPIMQELRQNYTGAYTYSLVVGGLRTTGQMPWNEKSKTYLAQNWQAVAQKTHQTFNHNLLNKTDFDYNTYPACKAIVTVRELWGEEAAFDYLSRIQKAFYVNGIDITSLEVLSTFISQDQEILDQEILDREAFIDFYQSPRAELLMHHDFSKARSMGANAFPSVVKVDSDGHMVCLSGYRSLEDILQI
ncbi:MAG: DsbA family protein [Campylobacterota bacterium]|nr:DsbA family protein [Campylobacterota bacterium]